MRTFRITVKNIKPVSEVLEVVHKKCNKMNTTQVKEAIAEKMIRQYRIFDRICTLFGFDYQGYKKITTKLLQKAGVDYTIWYNDDKEMYIDLKSCIGYDYTNGIPLELTQNGFFTNRKDKKTTHDLYFLYDDYGVRIYLIPYKKIHDICWDIYSRKDKTTYEWHTSFNGTGEYIKYPPEKIADICFTLVEEEK